MRAISLIREALGTLLGTASAGLLLFVCLRQLTRSPGMQNATLDGMIPITTTKVPWLILTVVVLGLMLLRARAIGGERGWLWGLRSWGLRAGFWWSNMALLLFLGVLIYGLCTQKLADLRWPFALGYLIVTIPVLMAFRMARFRIEQSQSRTARSPVEAS